MPDPERSGGPELDRETVDFLDREAERLETTSGDVLRRLVEHVRSAREDGLSCPHCNNELLIEI
ncbi:MULTISPECIES: hypothetical protein [Halorussus]|uniref:hypothetical protein n=1 Tax=Halorussus TaxID=1070314 RepID=UPI00209EA08F|nr:hypothetical protein [Halorussus vallis]USZ74474.1 hypothetical protein NGM07_13590 [Halorussus vallis]